MAAQTKNSVAGIPPTIWTPHPKQALALACPIDEIFFGGAPGGGKSTFLLASFVQHASLYGEAASGLLVRRTLPELRAIQKEARKLYPQLGAYYLAKDRSWIFPNGAQLLMNYCETADDANRYLSTEFTWIACDEAGGYKDLDPIFFLRSRLRSPVPGVRKQFILTGNPGGPGHATLFERYIKDKPPYVPFTDPDTGEQRIYIPSRLTDNPNLMADPDYARRILSAGPAHLMRKILLGDWTIAPAGNVFLAKYWRYRAIPPAPLAVIQSWDIASKAKQQNDRSVCTTWFVYPDGFQLVDCVADRFKFPELKRMAVALAKKYQPHQILIEDTSSGTALVQELQNETTLPVLPVRPEGDKYARALAVTPLIEAGRVWLPDNSPAWLADFLLELGQFPDAPHDDIVDSVSQALLKLRATYTFGEGLAYAYEPVVSSSMNAKPAAAKNSFTSADDDDEPADWRQGTGTF